ncbi:MAG TPA: Tox-REase-5 domain-containing protein [Stellaceae bacterium]|jgi:hypothetical protein
MQGYSEVADRSSGRGGGSAKGLRLFINPPRLQLDDRTVIFKYTGDGGWFCASFGDGAKYMRATKEDPGLRQRIETYAQNIRRGREALGADLARVMAAVELSKDYDPDQARGEQGRWTSEGGGAVAAGAVADAFSLYGAESAAPALHALAQQALGAAAALLPEGAAAIAVPVVASVAVLGTLFLPTNQGSVSTGTLPDAPDLSYKYDRDTGRLTVTRQNEDGTTETLFSGHHSPDGVFRDEDGNAIGRYLEGSIALDADAVRGYEARRRSDAQAPPGAIAQSTATTLSDAKLCPDPGPDKSGFKSPGAIAYQMYVGQMLNGAPLPPGFGIKTMRPNGLPVYFDDCQRSTGALIEAKGLGYSDALNSGKLFPWLGMQIKMIGQAKRQLEAADGQPIAWYFAERDVADRMRREFAKRRLPISVSYLPPPRGLIGQLKRILEGGWREFSDFIDMLSKRQGSTVQTRDF